MPHCMQLWWGLAPTQIHGVALPSCIHHTVHMCNSLVYVASVKEPEGCTKRALDHTHSMITRL